MIHDEGVLRSGMDGGREEGKGRGRGCRGRLVVAQYIFHWIDSCVLAGSMLSGGGGGGGWKW